MIPFKKALVVLTASFSLSPVFAQAAPPQTLQTTKALMTQEMQRAGCVPPPEKISFKPGYTEDQQIDRNFFIDYCGQTAKAADALKEGFTAIADIPDPYTAILSLRAVPEEQKIQRNRVAQAAAIDIAQAAIDYAFAAGAAKDPFLAQSYKTLQDDLRRLPNASSSERFRIHKEAYDLRLTLEQQHFKYYYVMAAYAVSMAAAGGDFNQTGISPEAGKDREWVSLYQTAEALDSVCAHNGAAASSPGRGDYSGYHIFNDRHTDKAKEIVRKALLKHLPPQP